MSESIMKMTESMAKMVEAFYKDMKSVGAEDIYTKCIDRLILNGFFDMPASTKYHGTNRGDLFRHSMHVAYNLTEITEKMGIYWQDPRSPILIGYFHDLCKMDKYYWKDDTCEWIYRKDQLIEEHFQDCHRRYLHHLQRHRYHLFYLLSECRRKRHRQQKYFHYADHWFQNPLQFRLQRHH